MVVDNLPEQSASRRVAAENLTKLLVVELRGGCLAGRSWCGAAPCDWSGARGHAGAHMTRELVQRQEYLDTTNAEKYSEYF